MTNSNKDQKAILVAAVGNSDFPLIYLQLENARCHNGYDGKDIIRRLKKADKLLTRNKNAEQYFTDTAILTWVILKTDWKWE